MVGLTLLIALMPVLAPATPASRGRTRPAGPSPISNLQSPLLNAPAPVPAAPLPAPGTDFARYAVILSRMPFGDESAALAAAAAAASAANAAAVDSFTKTLKMCAITRNHFTGKIQVGLLDAATKKSYFLCAGESEDGIEIKEADYANEKALVKKGAEEVWMTMTEAKAMPAVVMPGGGVAMAPPLRRSEPPANPAPPQEPPQSAKPRLTGEALQKHLQNYQMELIRAGGRKGPPLPIALTPEMDAQLVTEGALPPSE